MTNISRKQTVLIKISRVWEHNTTTDIRFALDIFNVFISRQNIRPVGCLIDSNYILQIVYATRYFTRKLLRNPSSYQSIAVYC